MTTPTDEDRAAACAEYAIADWLVSLEQIGNGAFAAAAASRRNARNWSQKAAAHYARLPLPRRFAAAIVRSLPHSLTNHGGPDDAND
jgi:hypothetical protein